VKKDEFIVIESDALFQLAEILKEHIESKITPPQPIWVSPDETLKLLNIGISTLQKLRHEGKIVYSKISSKTILYEYQSILDFLEENKVL